MDEEETIMDAIKTWYSWNYNYGARFTQKQCKSLAKFITARLTLESASVTDGCDDE